MTTLHLLAKFQSTRSEIFVFKLFVKLALAKFAFECYSVNKTDNSPFELFTTLSEPFPKTLYNIEDPTSP